MSSVTQPSSPLFDSYAPLKSVNKPPRESVKRALLIGINYIGLKGSPSNGIPDAVRMCNYLLEHGYDQRNILLLTDDQQDAIAQPTKKNIVDGLKWLVRGAAPRDVFFFMYSGRGEEYQEATGCEEAICPVDYDHAGTLVGETLFDMLVRPLPRGAKLTAVFNPSFSGSPLDLPYAYSMSVTGGFKRYKVWQANEADAMQMYQGARARNKKVILSGAKNIYKRMFDTAPDPVPAKTTDADVTVICGLKIVPKTKPSKFPAFRSKPHPKQGNDVLCTTLVDLLEQEPGQTYLSFMQRLNKRVNSISGGKPQISCSHEVSMNAEFIV